MSEAYIQADRLLTIETPLGRDALLLEAFHGREAISTLFDYEFTVLSRRDDLKPEELVGKRMTATLRTDNDERRYFNGVIQRLIGGPAVAREFRQYRLEVVPWLWFLTRTSDCRIFQNKTVPEIVKEIFSDLGFDAYETGGLSGKYSQREYCVQYRETDFAFVSRLLEEEGIFYFFTHDNGKHTLVLADRQAVFRACPESKIKYSAADILEHHISSWEHRYQFHTGAWAHGEYNFETPRLDLTTQARTMVKLPGVENFELYDYPGIYRKKPEGEALSKIRIEEQEAVYDTVQADSDCRTLYAGGKFTLSKHDCPSEANKAYAIIALEHDAAAATYLSGAGGSSYYRNHFTCIPATAPFRPARITPQPLVHGSQTAMVVGPSGEEIHTDKYGRVKVQFHWDRRGKYDDKSSCWIRTSQSWAGRQWGAQVLPRVGMEVIVDFLEGNPDRPLVTGFVNNADTMPPYTLPSEKTKSAFKTRSTPGGGGFNEVRFEDKKGKEQVFIHAERDIDVRVKANRREWVGANRHLIIKKNRLDQVEGDTHSTIKGDHNQKIGGALSLKVGMEVHEDVGMNFIHKSGQNIVFEAGMMISLKAGGNFITIGPSGVMINGSMVLINSGGAASPLSAHPQPPDLPIAADDAKPGEKAEPPEPKRMPAPGKMKEQTVQAHVMRMAAQNGTPFCEKCVEAAAAKAIKGV
ncbi:MAG: type VI secretion system tip protein TssI/VgrG [Rhodospirillaceae bacterium]